jgi:hypothetical protein
MADKHYPSVDLDFLNRHIKASNLLVKDGIFPTDVTTTYIIKGNQAIHKRKLVVRHLEAGQVCLEQATSLALRFSFIGALMDWLEVNRSWKEGAYIVPPKENST